jgi:head-tail adaptor
MDKALARHDDGHKEELRKLKNDARIKVQRRKKTAGREGTEVEVWTMCKVWT